MQQQYMHYYDRKHREVTFAVGQLVWLRLLHRPLASLDVKGRSKLGGMELGSSFSLREASDPDSLASPLLVLGSLAVTLFFFAFRRWRLWAHHSLVNCWVGQRWVVG
jgi:hypothetical protein